MALPGVQDHGRSVRRHDHVLPHLFGHAYRGHPSATRPRTAKEASAACCLMASEQSQRTFKGSLCGDIVDARGPEGSATPATRCAIRTSR